jgi:hypothetical protein
MGNLKIMLDNVSDLWYKRYVMKFTCIGAAKRLSWLGTEAPAISRVHAYQPTNDQGVGL